MINLMFYYSVNITDKLQQMIPISRTCHMYRIFLSGYWYIPLVVTQLQYFLMTGPQYWFHLNKFLLFTLVLLIYSQQSGIELCVCEWFKVSG